MKKIFYLSLLITILFQNYTKAQSTSVLTTATPFLLISPDARSGGLGDMGVATSPDAYSQHYNAAKLAFSESQFTVAVNYTPWLRNLTNDVFLGNVSFTNKLNERSAWGANLTFFSLGTIELTNGDGLSTGSENPSDLAIAPFYALKLSDAISMAVTLKYIRSDLSIKVADNSDLQTVNTFAVDLGAYYQSEELNYGEFNGRWRAGMSISNMGPKVELTAGGTESFIPTNLRLGGGFDFILDDISTIKSSLEVTKLMVPTPQRLDDNGEIVGKDNDVDFFTGMFQSFGDAPDGFSEELQEFTWAIGAEYEYDETFAFRLGYFNEHEEKGARKFFSLGAGFKFRSSKIDVSYLLNSSDINNPLENTLRFSLSFDFGDFFEEF